MDATIAGNDPIIDCTGIALGWQGCVNIHSVSDVVVEDLVVRDVDSATPANFGFLVFINASSNITVQRVEALNVS
jgi:hypothetical protein